MKIDGEKLFICCAKRGWNLGDLAKKLDISKPALYGYKKRDIRPSTLYRLAITLGVEPEELLKR